MGQIAFHGTIPAGTFHQAANIKIEYLGSSGASLHGHIPFFGNLFLPVVL